MDDPVVSKTKRLIDCGADVVGALAGICAGFLAAPHPGAPILGASIQVGVKHTLVALAEETIDKTLSKRELQRSSAAFIYGVSKIKDRLDKGEHLRSDGFFDNDTERRAAAKEVFEGILMSAQRDHEEDKLRAYGNLIASLAFKEGYTRAHCNTILRLGERLSFRQLCLLSALHDARFAPRFRAGMVRPTTTERVGVIQELFQLAMTNLIRRTDQISMLDASYLELPLLEATGLGYALYYLMELSEERFENETLKIVTALS